MSDLRRLFRRSAAILALAAACASFMPASRAQGYEPSLFNGLRWRLIGPFRGGRALAVTGVPGQTDTFYFGAVAGGVWKTTDAGRVWTPVFDSQNVASIGAVAVAPSNPDIVYVGTGEADMRSDITYGDGMYRSADGGKTWRRIGLEDTRQIGCVLVDPRDPNLVYVAALGHSYGPNAERGVFRSRDGGKTWKKVLYKNDDTGAIDLAFDPRSSKTIYAALWQTRRPPWNVYPPSNGPGSGLYKSTDGGDTWSQLTNGLPTEGLGRIGVAVAPDNASRVYALVDAKAGGLYRSDDAGASWRMVDNEPRIWGRGWYFGGVTVDPKHADTVYVMNTSTYRSTNGGKDFTAIKGAPGGDDYHTLWIEPDDPDRMILSSDQGVIVSVDGARTWSSWYNQPTAQFYHVAVDNRFPYWVYGAQQDSGAAGTTSRSRHREISDRDWLPISVGGESGYIAPDPLHPGILFGGTVTRYDISLGMEQSVPPSLAHPGNYRRTWTQPLVFSPADPHALYFGTQVLFETPDGGRSWQVISPDLAPAPPGAPPNLDPNTAADTDGNGKAGVIYTISPSPLDTNLIWAGTDTGYIHVTGNGGKVWRNVTPAQLTPWSKITCLEASHYDANEAFAAVDRHRLDDLAPYIYRTRDGGKTWRLIADGIDKRSYVNVVREDPVRRGLVYAGTETGMFVSFDDGDHWQPLQLNLPAAPVRDLAIHDADLVAATHGRSFWILDDVTPLRQLSPQVARSQVYLYRPETAWRVQPGSDEGTPLPPEAAQGENPPNGAILDYNLKSAPAGPVTLEILDSAGKLVRRFSSADKVRAVNPKSLDIPAFWVHPAMPPSGTPGMHRFVWDLHYAAAGRAGRNPAAAMFGFGGGPWAVPGEYTVRLTVGDRSFSQPLTVMMDPRVRVTRQDLQRQLDFAQRILAQSAEVNAALSQADEVHGKLKALEEGSARLRPVAGELRAVDAKTIGVVGAQPPDPFALNAGQAAPDYTSLRYVARALGELERVVESGDAAPSADALAAFSEDRAAAQTALDKWEQITASDLPRLNKDLQRAHLQQIALPRQRAAGGRTGIPGGGR